ncbi:aspartate/glutamate/uridylate kinase [Methanoregula boonei 6A8]|uniref:Aspartate/glutamate/uridylate kinase n=1 Tax=Methanoregula boonei (strain DSM 21154 / JCM 14090 / 6A8) TaxID=456442 RepID=A7I5K1_METB6|nr:aspartate/glutamate/uridylate kinase [Methanoregula boonei]ABS55012.1 aspartate/glutamate/uridylate kinase [Methanoregula boonei 6A8]
MRSQVTHGGEEGSAHLTVVKLGGSLARHAREIIPVIRAARRPLLIVPGGGVFADAVRQSEADSDTAHWMACAAMDQYGWMLAAQGIKTTSRLACPAGPRILLPYCTMRRHDPLPHSWDVTSDTIAAWVAGRLGGDLLVLKSVDGITDEGKLVPRINKPRVTDVVDPQCIPYVLEHRIRTFILNGTDPARIERWLRGVKVPGTCIGTTF